MRLAWLEQPELLLSRGRRAAQAGTSAARQLVPLERLENLGCTANDRRRHAGEPRDLDAVTSVRSARHDLVQKNDVVLELARRDVAVGDRRQRIGEVCQLVVMRRE